MSTSSSTCLAIGFPAPWPALVSFLNKMGRSRLSLLGWFHYPCRLLCDRVGLQPTIFSLLCRWPRFAPRLGATLVRPVSITLQFRHADHLSRARLIQAGQYFGRVH